MARILKIEGNIWEGGRPNLSTTIFQPSIPPAAHQSPRNVRGLSTATPGPRPRAPFLTHPPFLGRGSGPQPPRSVLAVVQCGRPHVPLWTTPRGVGPGRRPLHNADGQRWRLLGAATRGLVGVGPYADSLPLSCHLQGEGGGGGWVWAGRGAVQRGVGVGSWIPAYMA